MSARDLPAPTSATLVFEGGEYGVRAVPGGYAVLPRYGRTESHTVETFAAALEWAQRHAARRARRAGR